MRIKNEAKRTVVAKPVASVVKTCMQYDQLSGGIPYFHCQISVNSLSHHPHMATIIISTPFNIDLEFRTATVGKRMLAWLVDIVVISLYFYCMLRFIYPLLGRSEGISTAAELLVIILPVLLYQLSFELFANGQTIGKMLAGIKVIDLEGQEPTWGQYFIRWLLCIGNLFVYTIPYIIISMPAAIIGLMLLYLPDFLSVVISAKSQRLSDLAAGTVVIDKKYASNIGETIYLEIEDKNYNPVFPQVMRLTDRDINGIRNLINSKQTGKDPEMYIAQVAEKIKKVLSLETSLEPHDLLVQLLKDYNYYTARK